LNSHFPRIITLLRKERGLSQKSVAESLGVSQALLSHYEKGIRECGLDFVVKIADFYGVSCDYLLGRTMHPTGETVPTPVQPAGISRAAQESPEQHILNDTITTIYSLLGNCGNDSMTNEVSDYLFVSVYRIFRMLYSSNPKNPQGLFAIREDIIAGRLMACSALALSNLHCLLQGKNLGTLKGLAKGTAPSLSPEKLAQAYPNLSSSLFKLIQLTEKSIMESISGAGAAKSLK
jgi:DNA-binding XRE family transcriptional regulator